MLRPFSPRCIELRAVFLVHDTGHCKITIEVSPFFSLQEFRTDGSFSVIHPGSLYNNQLVFTVPQQARMVSSKHGLVITAFSDPFIRAISISTVSHYTNASK